MALTRAEAILGINFPAREKTNPAFKPVKLTSSEITRISLTVPDGLTPERPVETVVGTWSMEGGITIFDYKSEEELQRIRIPERRDRIINRAKTVAKVVFQMG